MRSGSDAIIIVFLYTTLTIATATTYIYGQGSKYNSQSINEGNLRNMINLNNIPVVMKNARTLPLVRMPLVTGGMGGKNLNRFSKGSTIGVNGLSSGFSGVQKGYRIRTGSVRGGKKIGLGINRVQNGFEIRMGSQHGIMNKMAGRISGGPQGPSFSNSYFPRGKTNTVPKMNAFGGGFSLIHNGFGSGKVFGYGRRTKMTGAMLGRPQGSSFGTSYLPSINGNPLPKMNGLGGDIHRIGNGHLNGMGSGHGNINKMAGGTPGGAQLTPFGLSFNGNPLPNMNGLGGDIHRIGNGHINGMGSGRGNINKMAGGTPGGAQLTPFGMSFNGNPLPTMKGLGGDIHRIGNRHINGMGSGYGNINKMAGGTPGGAQLTPIGMSFNGNPLPTMKGLEGDIHRIGNRHINGMGSGYGNINKMAGGTQGGAQLTPFGMSFLSSGNTNGHGDMIESAGLGTTFETSVGDTGDNMAMEEDTGAGDLSSGNQEIGDMVSNGFSSIGNGNPWETNDDVPDNFDHFDDSDDLGSDSANDFDDIIDQ